MTSTEKVKILVVGDSGVGKTSLVHLICQSEPIANPYWTIGCSVDVKLHTFKEGTPSEKEYYVELWDIGGFKQHSNSRTIYYNSVNGIILVYDLTNRKSQVNLRSWLSEIVNRGNDNPDRFDIDPETFAGSSSQVPILVIGSKLDQVDLVSENRTAETSLIAQQIGAEEIHINCTQTRHLSPGTGNSVKLSRFFDKIIERKFFSREGSLGPGQRRPHDTYKQMHSD